jgi:hypothetical protein
MSLAINMINNEDEISISSINALSQNFITNWFGQEPEKGYPNLLFDFQKLLKEKGCFEAYNYWFLMKGNEDEFGKWIETNEAEFNEFAEWFNENPLTINGKNNLSRLKYQNPAHSNQRFVLNVVTAFPLYATEPCCGLNSPVILCSKRKHPPF